ncbi:MAG: xylulokinase [Actinobacteria bacterium]|nr:xylulokinase [Actinomycetota bacterium]
MPIVAGVDSSTQSVKVVLRDADTGELVAQASEPHPDGTEVDPKAWEVALESALAKVDQYKIDAISIAGQQHGMVALDKNGEVLRKALLWNDTRSANAAEELNREIPDIHIRTGSRLVASFTASKVRWLYDAEPDNANRLAAVALPHDWLSWRLSSSKNLDSLFTDRSDASGTGYFNPETNTYDLEIMAKVRNGKSAFLAPRVLKPNEFGGETTSGVPIAAGAGDNAGAALGLGAKVGDLVISLGTSGTAFAVSANPTKDPTGEVAGFADATGNFLPLACTLNAAKVFASIAKMLNISLDEFSELALSAKSGAGGIRLLPHFDGERTPNRPNARGNFSGITSENLTRENLARAAIEGVVAGMVYAANSLKREGFLPMRILLIGGAAKSLAVQEITAEMFTSVIHLPDAGEYVADGAARQAAWALSGKNEIPNWQHGNLKSIQPKSGEKELVENYLELISNA